MCSSQNAKLTAGLICAPLMRPMGEIVISAPTVPKQAPASARRSAADGSSLASVAPGAKNAITTDSPNNNSSAVPAASARYRRGCNRLYGTGRPCSG